MLGHDPDKAARMERVGRAFGALAAKAHNGGPSFDGLHVHCPVFGSCGFRAGLIFGLVAHCEDMAPSKAPAVSADRRYALFGPGEPGPFLARLPQTDRYRAQAELSGLMRGWAAPYVSAVMKELHSGLILSARESMDMMVPLPCGCAAYFSIWLEELGACL